jgi:adenylate cyclase
MDKISISAEVIGVTVGVRQATVLFADLVDFTTFSEQLLPVELMTLLNQCFDSMAPAITYYDGALDRYEGDRLLAVFQGRTVRGHHAERALNAALAIQTEIAHFNQAYASRLPAPVRLHTGINTGPVAHGMVGVTGFRIPTVIGYTVNLAARLADRAGPDEILVGETTGLLTCTRFDLEPLTCLGLKGISSQVQAYRLCNHPSGRSTNTPGSTYLWFQWDCEWDIISVVRHFAYRQRARSPVSRHPPLAASRVCL